MLQIQACFKDRRLAVVVAIWMLLMAGMCARNYIAPLKGSVFPLYCEAGRYWTQSETCYNPSRPEPFGGYRYAPLVSVFFVPWNLLPYSIGSILWRCLNAAMLFGGFVYFMRVLSPVHSLSRRDWALMLLAMIPLAVGGLNNGQVNPLIVGLLLIAVAACREERWNLTTVCIVLATWLKIYPLAVGMLLIVAYPRMLLPRMLLGLAVGFAVPFLMQLPHYVWSEYQEWYAFLAADDRRRNLFPIAYQDVHLLFRILDVHLSRTVYGLLQLGTAGLLALYVWRGSRREGATPHLLASLFHLGCVWMLLLGPSTEGSTYVILAPTFACAVLDAVRDPRSKAWQRGAVFIAGVLFLTRFILVAFPAGRLYTYAFFPLGTLLIWVERWSRALTPVETENPIRSGHDKSAIEWKSDRISDAYKDPLAMHPVQDQPHHEQHADAENDGLRRLAENVKHVRVQVTLEHRADVAAQSVGQGMGDE